MPAVLVHGVPDTPVLWDGVRSNLSRSDVVALAVPGFGIPRPENFDATKEAYVEYIIEQLEQMDEPVDLVGHDFGCIWTARVASLRPDLVRTWAGGSGPLSADYEWHPWAIIWQTPQEGEQWMADLDPGEFSETLQSFDVPADNATKTAHSMDATMKDCILRLYRSSVHLGAEWEPSLADITSPSLIFWGVDDPACPIDLADRMGQAIEGAEVLRLDANHWTPLQRPAEIAQALERHWAAAPAPSPTAAA